jgi:D-alanine-D-alanine ligase
MVLRTRDDADDTRLIVRTPDEYSGALSHLSSVQLVGVLCEAWIEGTLISVGVLGNDRLRCLPIASFNPSGRYFESSAPVDEPQAQHYRSLALRAFRSIGCRDFARVDMVVDRQGQAYVVGVYTNTILEKRGAIAVMAHAAGLSWPQLMGTIVELAGTRCGVDRGGASEAMVGAESVAKPRMMGA